MSTTLEELIVGLGLDTSDYDKGISSASSKSESFIGGLTSSFGKVTALLGGAKIFEGLGKGFDFIKDSAIGMNSQLETSTLQFQTLMGSADKAETHVKDLFSFAKSTPFETQPIIDASATMETFGGAALDTMDNLTLFGNAAAATTKPITDISFWSSRMYAALQAGKPIGEATANLMQLGVVGPDTVNTLEALAKSGATGDQIWAAYTQSLKKFDGAMALQANTWQGLKSSISDTLSILGAQAFKPVFDVAKQGLASLLNILSSDAVTKGVEKFGASFAAGVSGTITSITNFVSGLQSVIGTSGNALIILGNLLGSLEDISPIFSNLANFVYTFADSWSVASEYTSSFAEQLGATIDLLFGFEGTFQELGYQITTFFTSITDGASPVNEVIANMADQLTTRFNAVIGVFNSLVGVVVSIFAVIAASFTNNSATIDILIQAYENAQTMITGVIVAVGAVITAILGEVQKFIDAHGTEITAKLSQAWLTIADIVNTAIQIINKTVVPILTAVAAYITDHSAEIQNVLTLAWNVIAGVVTTTLNLISGLLHVVLAAINGDWRGAWSTMQETSASFVQGIYDVIQNGIALWLASLGTSFAQIRSDAETAFNGLVSFIQGIPASLADVGYAIVDAIWSGFKSRFDDFVADAKAKLQSFRDMLPFSEPRDRSSPLYGLGRSGAAIVGMLQEGINAAGTLKAPALSLDNTFSSAPLAKASAAGSKMSGTVVNANIDARGADVGAADRISNAMKQLTNTVGNNANIRIRLGAI